MNVISREEAKERGLKRYFTGKPCSNGHVCEKLVSNWTCVECAYTRRKDKNDIYYRTYYDKNRGILCEKSRKYRNANLETCKEKERIYRELNKEKRNAYSKDYDKANRASANERDRWRKEQIRKATPRWANREAILKFYQEADRLTRETGIRYSVDHIIPIKNKLVCGLHVEFNLRVIPLIDNIKKRNRFDE